MTEPLLQVQQVSKRFGGLLAVNQASFTAPAGRITALIGPNGAGKTTLFSIVTGFRRAAAASSTTAPTSRTSRRTAWRAVALRAHSRSCNRFWA